MILDEQRLRRMEDRGLYILVIRLEKSRRIKIAKFPKSDFKAGVYLYVGRAKRGLRNRLDRHLRKEKKLFWHIDYLLRKSTPVEVWIKYGCFDECQTVGKIKELSDMAVFPQKHFGASDCHCPGHLLYLPEADDLGNLLKNLDFSRAEHHGNEVQTHWNRPFSFQND